MAREFSVIIERDAERVTHLIRENGSLLV